MNNKNNISDSLLGKYLTSANLSDEEKSDIERWKENDSDANALLRDIESINLQAERLKRMSQIDSVAALGNVNAKINKINRFSIIYNRWQKVAAIMVLPLMALSLLQYLYNDSSYSVTWHEAIAQYGMISKVVLPDSSIVELNSRSSLRYPSKFADDCRVVELQGEGFFKVKSNKEYPFLVKCGDVEVQAVGTAFNVRMKKNGKIVTSLEEGTVNILRDIAGSDKNKLMTLTPGQTVVYDSNSSKISEVQTTDIEKYMGWRDGQLIFRSDQLSYILEDLESKYDVVFDISPTADLSGKFTGTFVNKDLKTVLEFISLTTDVRFEQLPEKTDKGRVVRVK